MASFPLSSRNFWGVWPSSASWGVSPTPPLERPRKSRGGTTPPLGNPMFLFAPPPLGAMCDRPPLPGRSCTSRSEMLGLAHSPAPRPYGTTWPPARGPASHPSLSHTRRQGCIGDDVSALTADLEWAASPNSSTAPCCRNTAGPLPTQFGSHSETEYVAERQ